MTKPKATLKTGNLTYQHKAKLVEYKQQNPKVTLAELARWIKNECNLAKVPLDACISRTLSNKEKFQSLSVQDLSIK